MQRVFGLSLLWLAAIVFTPGIAFATGAYLCKLEARYGTFDAAAEYTGESTQEALSMGMQGICRRACDGVEASSKSSGSDSCEQWCLREASFPKVYCIHLDGGKRVRKAVDAAEIEALRTMLTTQDKGKTKPELYRSKKEVKPLLLTQWYGAYESSSRLTQEMPAPRKNKKSKREDLLELYAPKKPLILVQPRQAPLLNMR